MSDKIIKAYKFLLKPSKTQSQKMNDTLYLCQQLYNAALAERRDAYTLNRVSINYQHQQSQLPEIKKTNPEYQEVYSQVLQNVLKRVDLAFQGFFTRIKRREKAGFPRFRSLNSYDSFTFPQGGFSLTANKLRLSKIGIIKLKLSRRIIGKVKTLTIKNDCGRWFAVFTVETFAEHLPKTGLGVGIDAGIESFVTLSDGTQIDNRRYYESAQKELRRAQRSVSRKKKNSNNRRKAVLKLRKIHQKIRNRRTDFQHKFSTYLVKTYDLIAIEKLNILGMSRGILSKQIRDASWSSFFNMIRYKAENAGKELIEVNPNGTSQTCVCGEPNKKDLSVRWHKCLKCGLSEHRDIVSSKVILKAGRALLAQTKAVGL